MSQHLGKFKPLVYKKIKMLLFGVNGLIKLAEVYLFVLRKYHQGPNSKYL